MVTNWIITVIKELKVRIAYSMLWFVLRVWIVIVIILIINSPFLIYKVKLEKHRSKVLLWYMEKYNGHSVPC